MKHISRALLHLLFGAGAWVTSPKSVVAAVVSATGSAGLVSAPGLGVVGALANEPAISGALGGAISALLFLSTVDAAVDGPHNGKKTARQALFAVLAGSPGAHYSTPILADWFGLDSVASLAAIGFFTGVMFWRVAPTIIAMVASPENLRSWLPARFGGAPK